ncbi:MAG TPA: CBS domain-containing protein [Ktedonobacteraceae bacterium]
MLYLSQLLGAPVEDHQGARAGKIVDFTMPLAQLAQPEFSVPRALLVEDQEGQRRQIPLEAVEWHDHTLRLRLPLVQFSPHPTEPSADEVSLAEDVLDKQVIDIEHKKAVRVNDVCLGDDWRLLGIDNSTLGLVRRLAPNWLLGTKNRRASTNLIPWEQIELIGIQRNASDEAVETRPATQRPQSGQLAELHPADIAEIVHQLTPGQGARLIEGLDNETAADAMEEIDTERQGYILENIQPDRAADILDAMEPDEAADLLAHLPEERALELLGLMQREESEDVAELLEYEADSAGGLMTTDYVVVNQTKSVAEALESVCLNILEHDIRTAYIYCVNDETQDECIVLGVLSLWDLLAASSTQPLRDLMETDLITVQPDTDAHEVAQIMAKYNLLAVPVVNEHGILEGVVTVDDALDVLLPADKQRKPTRMY